MRSSLLVDPDAGIAFVFGAECIAEKRGALVAEVVFAAVGGGVPLAALEQDHAEAGGGKFLGDDASGGASADDDGVDALHELPPLLRSGAVVRGGAVLRRSYCARPRRGGSSRPSMCQLTASRLPPWRGEP